MHIECPDTPAGFLFRIFQLFKVCYLDNGCICTQEPKHLSFSFAQYSLFDSNDYLLENFGGFKSLGFFPMWVVSFVGLQSENFPQELFALSFPRKISIHSNLKRRILLFSCTQSNAHTNLVGLKMAYHSIPVFFLFMRFGNPVNERGPKC